MDISSIALSGLERAQSGFEQAAVEIAGMGAPPSSSPPVDTVDLSAAAVNLMESRAAFTANIAMLKAADRMERQSLDLLA